MRRFTKYPTLLLLAIIALSWTNIAQAVLIPLEASIDGAQANAGAGTGSPGTGSGTITFDTNTNLLTWEVTWSGLSGADVLAHFHGPALPNQNAGVQVGIGIPSPRIGNAVLDAGQAADLLADLWYINIHSTTFQGGEIRGQVLPPSSPTPIPEPSTYLLFAVGILGIIGMAYRRRKKAA